MYSLDTPFFAPLWLSLTTVKLDVSIGIGSDIDIRYRHPPLAVSGCRYQKPIPTSGCRYRVPFRTLTVPDTVTATDTGIRYRYRNGRSLHQSFKGDRCEGAGLPPSAFLPFFPLSPFILHLFTPSFAGVPSSRGSSRRSNFCRLSSHFGWGLRHELQND